MWLNQLMTRCALKAVPKAIVVFLIANVSMAAWEPSSKTPDNISGSLGVVRAFQAMQTGQINALIEALSTKPSPVNDPLTLKTQHGEIQFLLAHAAPLTRSMEMVAVLAQFDANFRTPDSNGRGVIHYASFAVPEVSALFGYRPFEHGYAAATMITFFCEQGLDADSPDRAWQRPIHHAAIAGDPDVIRALVALEVDVNAADDRGQTPAVLSARRLHLAATEALRNGGAKAQIGFLDYVAGFGNRARDFASNYVPPLFIGVALLAIRPLLAIFPGPAEPQQQPLGGDDDPDLDEVNSNIPRARSVVPGAKGSAAGRSLEPVQPPLRREQPREVAQEKPKVITTTTRLRSAANAINGARQAKNYQDMGAALTAADQLLSQLEPMELKEEEMQERGHLVAAIKSIINKVKTPPITLRQQANALWEKWKKYHRSESKRR